MRKKIVLAVLLLGISTTAYAAPLWTQPGWYQVADTIVGFFVWAGPFSDKSQCDAALPTNEADADYTCEYLAERPDWDD